MGFFGSLFGGGNPYQDLVNKAGSQYGTLMGESGNLFGQSQSLSSMLTPFYQQEMTNPQGFGPTAMSQMLTQSGQSIAGGEGAAKRTGMDLAARTGNTSAIPSIIASTNKSGMVQQDDANNKIQIGNLMQKLNQQQQGASGLNALSGRDLSASLDADNIANSTFQNLMKSKQLSVNQENQNAAKEFNDIQSLFKLAGGV
jgi:hypothetical protein